MGGGLELGSGLQISKFALGLVLGLRALMGPIFEIGTPDPVSVGGVATDVQRAIRLVVVGSIADGDE